MKSRPNRNAVLATKFASEAMQIDVEKFKAKYREFWPSAWPDNALMAKEFDEVLRASINAAIAKATS